MKTETTKMPANNKAGFVLTDENSAVKDWGTKATEPAAEAPKADTDAPAEDAPKGKGKKGE